MTPGNFHEKTIIQALQSGDQKKEEWAMSMLLECFERMIEKLVMDRGGNAEDVAEILNDSVLATADAVKQGKYKPEKAKLKTYTYQIALNQWLTRYKKNKTREKNEDLYMKFLFLFESQMTPIERKIEMEELASIVADALEKLDENCYQVLKKFWLENKEHKQIADELSLTPDNVRQRNHRCKEKLKKILGKDPRI